jgi:hypothetical protein
MGITGTVGGFVAWVVGPKNTRKSRDENLLLLRGSAGISGLNMVLCSVVHHELIGLKLGGEGLAVHIR